MLVTMAVSCESWLDVTSSSQLQADKLFETRSGFHEALTGIYMNMGEEATYGGYYTWSVNNYTAYPYNIVDGVALIKDFQQHNYTTSRVKSVIKTMWKGGYNTIANINIILRELEARRNVISSTVEYNLIKGELLALRAYIHFDMMRMWGVNKWDGENASKLTIPYSTTYSPDVVAQKSYAETELLLLDDIKEAIKCLKESDPIVAEMEPSFESALNADGYWTNRTKHLNYYAALGLAAKIYQWKNDYATAAIYASEVLEGAFASGLVAYVDADAMVKQTSHDLIDWNFTSEHVFSLEVTNLYSTLRSLMFSNERTAIYTDESLLNQIFSSTGASLSGIEDIRGTALQMKFTNFGYSSYKYYGSTSYSSEYRNRIPMMRISEMHYIMAESYIADGNNEAALAELDKVRMHRGITDALASEVDAASELLLEYHREFIGEDKLFYYLKHKNVENSISSTFDVTASQLIYPYPDDEINYGRKQDL